MAKTDNTQENPIDQPSEDVIDLSEDQIAKEDGEELVSAEKMHQPLFGGMGGIQALTGLPVLLSGLVLSIVGVVWLLAINTQQAEREARYIEQSSQLLMLSQRLAKDAREAVLGQPIAFKSLKESRDRFDTIVNTLRDGSGEVGLDPSPSEVSDQLSAVIKLWAPKANEGMRAHVDQILGQEKSLFNMHDRVMAINQMSPLLLATADEVVEVGGQAGMKQADLYLAGRQGMLSQRIAKDVNLFSQGGNEAAVAAAQFGKDAKLFKDTEAKLMKTAPGGVKSKLQETSAIFNEINGQVEGILNNAAELFVSQRASQQVFEQSDTLLKKAHEFLAAYSGLASARGGVGRARTRKRRNEPADPRLDSQAA